jgi:hypothetical protein
MRKSTGYKNYKSYPMDKLRRIKIKAHIKATGIIKNCGYAYSRGLGAEIINYQFPGCRRHHINKDQVICIPKETHMHYAHTLSKPDSMVDINREAFIYLTQSIKQL